MARGLAEYILLDKIAAALHRENFHHLRIARSHVAKLAMAKIMRRFTPPADGERISFHRPPPFMKELTIRFNNTHLSGQNHLQLDCRTMWRISPSRTSSPTATSTASRKEIRSSSCITAACASVTNPSVTTPGRSSQAPEMQNGSPGYQ